MLLKSVDPLQRLRVHAVTESLFRPTTLKAAVDRLGFVQADPIRSPATAQDLILRHRVKGYRTGDLERRYTQLDIEEDTFYAYGFLTRAVWNVIHPRPSTALTDLHKKILGTVCSLGQVHPREMEAHFGRDRVINDWGGYSKATTRTLDDLHHRGLLRIAKRDRGIRVYEAARPPTETALSSAERLRHLIMRIAGILAPVPLQTLRANIAHYQRLGNTKTTVARMIRTGELEQETIDEVSYLWPSGSRILKEAPRIVRFLAPFDPVVWDRRRFEHLWRWAYRFEAYTPPARRIRGYYAMPLLWGDSTVGWVNAKVENGKLSVEPGFTNGRPPGADFRTELDAEVSRMEAFLSKR